MTVQNTSNEGDTNVVQFRIERGAAAMSTDGQIGVVEQIVVDRTNGQLLSLVIRGEETGTEFEMPASHVRRATGSHVYLDVSGAELRSHPDMTAPYDPGQYVPVYQGSTLPPGVASRVAAENEKPVITDVEENAASLVAPEAPPAPPTEVARRTDERAPEPSHPAGASDSTADTDTVWIPDEGAILEVDRTPTLKLNRADVADVTEQAPTGWGEPIGPEERPTPLPEPSATPETTGPLMGGKPSSGGMGAASSVPTSPAPALDTVPTSPDLPPSTTEPDTSDAQPAPAPSEMSAGAPETAEERETLEGKANPMAASQPTPAVETVGAPEAAAGVPLESVETPRQMTAPSWQLANLRDSLPDLLLNMTKSPAVWIMATCLGAGALSGILIRRRDMSHQPVLSSQRPRETQSRAADPVGDTVSNAQRTAARTRQQARMASGRAARRGHWFRRGLLLGGVGAMLLAPRPGGELRSRLKATLDQWRSRSA